MDAQQIAFDFEKMDTTWTETGDQDLVVDTFETRLKLLPFLKLDRVVVLGQPNSNQFAFLKSLITLLNKTHEIKDMFIQSNQEPHLVTAQIESYGFTMIYDKDNVPNARPAIWGKLTTTSIVIAPSIPRQILHQAFKWSGFGILICTDIDMIVEDLRALNLPNPQGSIRDFFERIQKAGYKWKMPLLKGGETWCHKTSIHWFGGRHVLDWINSGVEGMTRMNASDEGGSADGTAHRW